MYKIHTVANRLMPANVFSIEAKSIICNDVTLPREFDEAASYNPHNVRMWLIGHMHGAVCAIFASHEQDAFDAACDADMMECFLVTDEDDLKDYYSHDAGVTGPDYTPLGNASEPHNLDDCWIAEVELIVPRDIKLIVKLARASEGGHDNLDF